MKKLACQSQLQTERHRHLLGGQSNKSGVVCAWSDGESLAVVDCVHGGHVAEGLREYEGLRLKGRGKGQRGVFCARRTASGEIIVLSLQHPASNSRPFE